MLRTIWEMYLSTSGVALIWRNPLAAGKHLLGACDGSQLVQSNPVQVSPWLYCSRMVEIFVRRRVFDEQLGQKPIDLGFGKRVRPFVLDRILCREDGKERREPVRLVPQRDRPFFHHLQQSRLGFRWRAINFVREKDRREDRSLAQLKSLRRKLKGLGANDVGGHQVGSELHPPEFQAEQSREPLATRVLPTPGTPSSRACPPQRKVPMSCSSRSCWPAKTRSRPPRIASACWRIRSSSIKLLSQCDQFPSECAHGCRICRPVAAFNKAFPLTQQLLQFRVLMAPTQADGADAADDALHCQRGRPGSLIEKGRRLHVLAGRAPLGDHKRFGRPEADIAAEEINANQHGRNQTEGAGPRQCQQKSGERFDAAVPVSILVEAEHASRTSRARTAAKASAFPGWSKPVFVQAKSSSRI